MGQVFRIYTPEYTEVYCPWADDFVAARDGFCSSCGKTDHEETTPNDAA